MIRRYDLTRSDNYVYTGRQSYVCSGNGSLTVVTGFPVTSARIGFATLLWPPIDEDYSSSSSSSSIDSSSSSSSSSEDSYSSESTYSDTSSSSSTSQSSISEITGLPRIYVASYTSDGFVVNYENIPEDPGYIEFEFSCH